MAFGPFDAVVFDLDGVIVDSEPRHERAFLRVFEEIGYAVDHGMDFAAYLGRSDRALWEDFIARHRPAEPIEELLERKERTLISLLEEERPVYAGLPDLVRDLSRRYRLAVASGSRHTVIEAVLAMAGIRDAFATIASVQDVGKAKPAPDVFAYATQQLGLAPTRCCAIEDTVAGIESARAAGLAVIAVPHTYPEAALSRATRVVRDLDGIRELLLGRTSG